MTRSARLKVCVHRESVFEFVITAHGREQGVKKRVMKRACLSRVCGSLLGDLLLHARRNGQLVRL